MVVTSLSSLKLYTLMNKLMSAEMYIFFSLYALFDWPGHNIFCPEIFLDCYVQDKHQY